MKKRSLIVTLFITAAFLVIYTVSHGQDNTNTTSELNPPALVSGGLVAKIAGIAGIVWEVLSNVIPTKKNFSIIGNILSWLSKGGFRQPK